MSDSHLQSQSLIIGKNAVLSLLHNSPRNVSKVFLEDGQKPDKRIGEIIQLAKSNGIAVQNTPRQKMGQMLRPLETEGEFLRHQGVIAKVMPKPLWSLEELIDHCNAKPEGKLPLVLILDGVTDPRNFGAILRVADGAGVDAVLIGKHDSPGMGPAVSKTASGAEFTVNICQVGNLNQALERLKKENFWIYGTALADKALHYTYPDYTSPVAIVMGSEGKGIRPSTMKHCDGLVLIPMLGQVQSLNVSVSTGIVIYEVLRQRGVK